MHTFAYMAFYKSISDHYDAIFPLNPMQLDFVLKSFEKASGLKVMDVGCGTGSLCLALAPHFREVIGIDPDVRMLQLAIEKAGSEYGNVSFQPYGMLDLDKEDQFRQMDAVLCFGNTLVHLSNEAEVLDFLKQAKMILKPGGKLLIQIINYDRIIDQKIKGLPTIENEFVKFTRKYAYHPEENLLDFETSHTIKSEKREIKNIIQLYPIRQAKLLQLVRQSGFSSIRVWGNFKREALVRESIPLVIEVVA